MAKEGLIQNPARGLYMAKISAAPISADERELFAPESDAEEAAFTDDDDPFA